MPSLGEAGYRDYPSGRRKAVWSACLLCGAERWVDTRRGQPVSRWCYPCGRRAGKPRGGRFREASPNWRGGRHISAGGYVQLVVALDDPLLVMADTRGRVYEHRLVMARHLGRPLTSDEQVHHRNGNKQDNRLSNLELTSLADHAAAHKREVEMLRRRVQELEREIREGSTPAP